MHQTQSHARDRRDLLIDFLTGDERVHRRFFQVFTPVMMGQARRIAPDLPEDLWEEIVQGALLILIQTRPDKYDATKGSPEAFVGLAVWDAMRRVRSDNAPPGQMTRRENERKKRGASQAVTPPVPTDAFAPTATPQVISFENLTETLGGGMEGFAEVEHHLDAEKIMMRATRPIAVALRLIHWDDLSKTEASVRLALPRTTLNDQLDTFGRQFAIAA